MAKPLIGLTVHQESPGAPMTIHPAYLAAVTEAGGIPVCLPYGLDGEDIHQLLSSLDGVLFTGGSDIHPFFFGEETHQSCGGVSIARDRSEIALAQAADAAGIPVFGICRGVQILNVALGGSIYQDLPSQFSARPETSAAGRSRAPESDFPIAHRQPFSSSLPAHRVFVTGGSLLERITGQDTLEVNSLHHQAVRRLAPGTEICAQAPDGVIEAIWKPDHPFFLGVQWHPEHLQKEHEEERALFQAFLHAAGQYAALG